MSLRRSRRSTGKNVAFSSMERRSSRLFFVAGSEWSTARHGFVVTFENHETYIEDASNGNLIIMCNTSLRVWLPRHTATRALLREAMERQG